MTMTAAQARAVLGDKLADAIAARPTKPLRPEQVQFVAHLLLNAGDATAEQSEPVRRHRRPAA